MSRSSRKSAMSCVQEDLRAMLDYGIEEDDTPDKPTKSELTKNGQDWKTVPDECIKVFAKPPPCKSQNKVPNIWSFPHTPCIKHQTESAPCNCGIGPGFSVFIENVNNKEFATSMEDGKIPIDFTKPRDPAKNITTLIPEELHVKKYRGGAILKLVTDEDTTTAQSHGDHDMVVPRRTPATRDDVVRLKDIFKRLLLEAGLGESLKDIIIEKRTNSEIENLIELVRAEQEVYNIIFHEIIRQVTVDCAERGEILAELREFYVRLISKMPRLFMKIHQENIIQRSLDRRLMEELIHFKIRFVQVVVRLDNVHRAYRQTQGRIGTAQEELKHALIESEKSSIISDQLHDLYKMQKDRQDAVLASYARQCAFWKHTCNTLMSKVVTRYRLGLFRHLITSLDWWMTFVHRVLEEREGMDNDQVQRHFLFLKNWSGRVEDILTYLTNRDQRLHTLANTIWHSIDNVLNQTKAEAVIDPSHYLVTPFEGAKEVTLHKAIVQWCAKFALDASQIEDGFTGSIKVCQHLGKMEKIRSDFQIHTMNHILLPIRDTTFTKTIDKNFEELSKQMKSVHSALEGSYYKGIDPIVGQIESAMRMWSKRNLRQTDLAELKQELANWSINLQKFSKSTDLLLWDGKLTNFDVVRETIMLKIGAYRNKVIECLTDTLHAQKLELQNIEDKVTQWTAQCLVHAAPSHPTLPDIGRMLLEQSIQNVKQLNDDQKNLTNLISSMTTVQDNSWQLICQQGGTTSEPLNTDSADLSAMIRAECARWSDLSGTVIMKLKNGELFTPDVATRDIGVATEPLQQARGQHVGNNALKHAHCQSEDAFIVKSNETYSISMEISDQIDISPSSSELDSNDSSNRSLTAHYEIGEEQTLPVDAKQLAVLATLNFGSQGSSHSTLASELAKGWTMKTQLIEKQPMAEKNASSSTSKTRRGNLRRQTSNKQSRIQKLAAKSSQNGRFSRTKSNEKQPILKQPSGNEQKVPQFGPNSSAPQQSLSTCPLCPPGCQLSPSSCKPSLSCDQMSVSPDQLISSQRESVISLSNSRLGPKLEPPIILPPSHSSNRDISTHKQGTVSSKHRNFRAKRRTAPPHPLTIEPDTKLEATVKPEMRDAFTMDKLAAVPQEDKYAQTEYTEYMHIITFPEFMIEMFARELKTTDAFREALDERERITPLQICADEMELMQKRMDERERNYEDLQRRLSTAKDDIESLKHRLHAAETKLKNASKVIAPPLVESDMALPPPVRHIHKKRQSPAVAKTKTEQQDNSTSKINKTPRNPIESAANLNRTGFATNSTHNEKRRPKSGEQRQDLTSTHSIITTHHHVAKKTVQNIINVAADKVQTKDVCESASIPAADRQEAKAASSVQTRDDVGSDERVNAPDIPRRDGKRSSLLSQESAREMMASLRPRR